MSDTARDIQPTELVSTSGLDDLFELDANSLILDAPELEIVREPGANCTEPVRELDGYISVEKAAAIAGISVRAIQKRLKRGTLDGVKTKHGSTERWLVNATTLSLSQADASTAAHDATSLIVDASEVELVREPGANGADPVRQLDAPAVEDYKDKLIADLQNHLQAASWRNGYLESKLEEREREIKLLTDSQHKPSWWQRFKAFFVKQ
ncbi:MAG: hypothetical protein HC888_07075 [Candidatus Competibacteraceae bacterium]|nr:hypothetical protein [Candidatus Competibacteraceae bacterium]